MGPDIDKRTSVEVVVNPYGGAGTLIRVCWMLKAHVPYARAKATATAVFCTHSASAPSSYSDTGVTIWREVFCLS